MSDAQRPAIYLLGATLVVLCLLMVSVMVKVEGHIESYHEPPRCVCDEAP